MQTMQAFYEDLAQVDTSTESKNSGEGDNQAGKDDLQIALIKLTETNRDSIVLDTPDWGWLDWGSIPASEVK